MCPSQGSQSVQQLVLGLAWQTLQSAVRWTSIPGGLALVRRAQSEAGIEPESWLFCKWRLPTKTQHQHQMRKRSIAKRQKEASYSIVSKATPILTKFFDWTNLSWNSPSKLIILHWNPDIWGCRVTIEWGEKSQSHEEETKTTRKQASIKRWPLTIKCIQWTNLGWNHATKLVAFQWKRNCREYLLECVNKRVKITITWRKKKAS